MKERPHKGTSERNNDRSKAPDELYDIDKK